MTPEQKIHDIIETMVEWNLMDPKRALLDKQYLIECVSNYLAAKKVVDDWLNKGFKV